MARRGLPRRLPLRRASQRPVGRPTSDSPLASGSPPRERELLIDGDYTPATRATVADIEEALKDVVDPELGINVVDLGLIYGLNLEDDGSLTIDMTLTSAACPLTDVIEDQTDTALEGLVERFVINRVWMPPWGMEKITDDGREQLRALGFNV